MWGNGQSDTFNLEFDGDGVGIEGLVDFGVCIHQNDLILLIVEGIVLFQSSGDLIDDLLVRFVPIELLQSVDDKLFTGNSDLFAIRPRLAPIQSFGGRGEKFCAFRSCYFLIGDGQAGSPGSSAAGQGSGNCNSGSGQSGEKCSLVVSSYNDSTNFKAMTLLGSSTIYTIGGAKVKSFWEKRKRNPRKDAAGCCMGRKRGF